jgi:hypothetical protein
MIKQSVKFHIGQGIFISQQTRWPRWSYVLLRIVAFPRAETRVRFFL